MDKLIYSDANTELLKSAGHMISLVEKESHIKSASSSSITREMLRDCKPDKDHFLMHVIALGDEEHYGFNRNGDSFEKEACIKFHDTFVKNGAFYREHKHQPEFAIGQIKASAYNPEMGRIELAVWGHKKKAEEEYEQVKNGNSLSFSMSCRVPYDVSSITGKKQKTTADYDEYCKYRMGQYIPEHKKYAYVKNPTPTFFDISRVRNPADRIAHYIEYILGDEGSDMKKAASFSDCFLSSADIAKAEGIIIPGSDAPKGCANQIKNDILNKMAAAENKVELILSGEHANDESFQFYKNAARFAFDSDAELSEEQLQAFSKLRPGTLFNKLASRQIFLPFRSFCAYAYGTTIKEASEDIAVKYALIKELPMIFKSLMGEDCSDLENLFDPDGDFESATDPHYDDEVQKFMDEVEEHFSIKTKPVKQRIIRITIKSSSDNNKDVDEASLEKINKDDIKRAKMLARAYGLYKISTIKALTESGNNLDNGKDFILIAQNKH